MKTPLRLFSFVFAFLSFAGQLSAQNCSTPGRYTNSIFPAVTKDTAIVYGTNAATNYSTIPFSNYAAQTLKLDFYEPEGDPATLRPLLILGFGGSFVVGSRTDLDSVAVEYAKRGYAVATIDYRLINVTNLGDVIPIVFGSAELKRTVLQDVIVKASADMRAAIRFFKYFQKTSPATYRIDTTKIFVGGASAGAIAALHTAYVDSPKEIAALEQQYAANGGLEGNTTHPTILQISDYTSKGIAGVVNIAGAILDTNAIDSNDPPVYSAQGTADEVIPYVSGGFSAVVLGAPLNIDVTFFGAKSITDRAMHLGLRNQLFPIVGGNHESPALPENISRIVTESSAFMQSIVCSAGSPLPVRLTTFTVRGQNCGAVLNWQSASELQSSSYEVQRSEDGISFTAVATVPSRNNAAGAAYSYRVEGATKAAWYRLKMIDTDGQYSFSPAQRLVPQCGGGITVSVYPNPAQAQATISGVSANQVVSLLSADGKLLWSQRASGQTVQIPLGTVEKGLLLVQVKDENGRVLSNTKLVRN